jgi:hypothetical protein
LSSSLFQGKFSNTPTAAQTDINSGVDKVLTSPSDSLTYDEFNNPEVEAELAKCNQKDSNNNYIKNDTDRGNCTSEVKRLFVAKKKQSTAIKTQTPPPDLEKNVYVQSRLGPFSGMNNALYNSVVIPIYTQIDKSTSTNLFNMNSAIHDNTVPSVCNYTKLLNPDPSSSSAIESYYCSSHLIPYLSTQPDTESIKNRTFIPFFNKFPFMFADVVINPFSDKNQSRIAAKYPSSSSGNYTLSYQSQLDGYVSVDPDQNGMEALTDKDIDNLDQNSSSGCSKMECKCTTGNTINRRCFHFKIDNCKDDDGNLIKYKDPNTGQEIPCTPTNRKQYMCWAASSAVSLSKLITDVTSGSAQPSLSVNVTGDVLPKTGSYCAQNLCDDVCERPTQIANPEFKDYARCESGQLDPDKTPSCVNDLIKQKEEEFQQKRNIAQSSKNINAQYFARCTPDWNEPGWMLLAQNSTPLSPKWETGYSAVSGIYIDEGDWTQVKSKYNIQHIHQNYGGMVSNVACNNNQCDSPKYPNFKTIYPKQIILFKNLNNDPINTFPDICTFNVKVDGVTAGVVKINMAEPYFTFTDSNGSSSYFNDSFRSEYSGFQDGIKGSERYFLRTSLLRNLVGAGVIRPQWHAAQQQSSNNVATTLVIDKGKNVTIEPDTTVNASFVVSNYLSHCATEDCMFSDSSYGIGTMVALALIFPAIATAELGKKHQNKMESQKLAGATRQCGTGVAFRIVPMAPMLCAGGYRMSCSNQRLNNYLKSQNPNYSDADVNKACIEYQDNSSSNSRLGSCVKKKCPVDSNNRCMCNTAETEYQYYTSSFTNKSPIASVTNNAPWSAAENVAENGCGVCVDTNDLYYYNNNYYISSFNNNPSSAYKIYNRSDCMNAVDENNNLLGYQWLSSYFTISVGDLKTILDELLIQYKFSFDMLPQNIIDYYNKQKPNADGTRQSPPINLTRANFNYNQGDIDKLNNYVTDLNLTQPTTSQVQLKNIIKNIAVYIQLKNSDMCIKSVFALYKFYNQNANHFKNPEGKLVAIPEFFLALDNHINTMMISGHAKDYNIKDFCNNKINKVNSDAATLIEYDFTPNTLSGMCVDSPNPPSSINFQNTLAQYANGTAYDNVVQYFSSNGFANANSINSTNNNCPATTNANNNANVVSKKYNYNSEGVLQSFEDGTIIFQKGFGGFYSANTGYIDKSSIIIPNFISDIDGNLIQVFKDAEVDIFAGFMPSKNSNNYLEQYDDYKKNTPRDLNRGYEINVGNGMPLKNGKYLFMFIQPLGVNGKPDPMYDPNNLFKDKSRYKTTNDIAMHPMVYQVYKEPYNGYIKRTAPRTGKLWYAILDLEYDPVCFRQKGESLECKNVDADGKMIDFYSGQNTVSGIPGSKNYKNFNTGFYKVQTKLNVPDASWDILQKIKSFAFGNSGNSGGASGGLVNALIITPIKTILFGKWCSINSTEPDCAPVVNKVKAYNANNLIASQGDYLWEKSLIYFVATFLTRNIFVQALYYIVVVLAVVVTGLKIVFGSEKLKISDIRDYGFRFAIIATLASPMAWDFYETIVVKKVISFLEGFISFAVGNFMNPVMGTTSMHGVAEVAFGSFDKIFNFIFRISTIEQLLAIVFSSFFGIIVAIALVMGVFYPFLIVAISCISTYVFGLIKLSLFLCFGPIASLSLVRPETKHIFENWWKNILSIISSQIMFFIGAGVFGVIIWDLMQSLFNFTICWEPIFKIPGINLVLLSGWKIAGDIPVFVNMLLYYSNGGLPLNGDDFSSIRTFNIATAIIIFLLVRNMQEYIKMVTQFGYSVLGQDDKMSSTLDALGDLAKSGAASAAQTAAGVAKDVFRGGKDIWSKWTGKKNNQNAAQNSQAVNRSVPSSQANQPQSGQVGANSNPSILGSGVQANQPQSGQLGANSNPSILGSGVQANQPHNNNSNQSSSVNRSNPVNPGNSSNVLNNPNNGSGGNSGPGSSGGGGGNVP